MHTGTVRFSGLAIVASVRGRSRGRTGIRTSSWRCSLMNCEIRWPRSSAPMRWCGRSAPTTRISCRTDLPESGPSQADLLHAVDVVGRQAQHLSRMVDDLMDLSRIGRGELAVNKETVELRTIVDQAIEATHPQFESRRHRLSVRIQDDPILINGDPGRLVQLLSNLLDNAAKYTPKGGEISIAAQCARRERLHPGFTATESEFPGIESKASSIYIRSSTSRRKRPPGVSALD